MRDWTDALGKTQQAEVLGFERDKIIMRDLEGKLSAMNTLNFEADDLELLTNKRLESSLHRAWHPIDDRNIYYWPINWKTDRRFRQQVVLLAFDSDTQKPRLILQHRLTGTPELTPLSAELSGPEATNGLKIALKDSVKQRSSTGVTVWMPLDNKSANTLFELSSKLQTIDYLLESTEDEKQSGKMSDEEFNASIEAIEIYRMIDRLNTKLVKPDLATPNSKTSDTKK